MSLRARLTIIYTTVLGAVLVLFGLAVYGLINTVLIRQIDDSLQRAAGDFISVGRVDETGRFVFTQPVSLDSGVFVQVWDSEANLVAISQSTDPGSRLRQPLDTENLNTTEVVFTNVDINGTSFRVLSVPLSANEMPIGVLQAGTSLSIIGAVRTDLIQFLLVLSAVATVLAGLIGLAIARRALAPLGTVTETALQITRADDLSRRIPYSGSPDDEVGRLIIAFNDTLARLDKLFTTQRRFIADIGHELRTPLTVMRGNLDLMHRTDKKDPESIQSIELEVDRLTRLVGDLLLLAQAEVGKLPLDRRQVELDTLLLEVFAQIRVLAAERIEVKIGDIDQVLVCGDRDRLKQVALNLLANAVKYTPEGGAVRADLSKDGDWAVLSVKDNGPGIAEEDLPHIFERFYRGDKARHRGSDGTGFGLGLSIAYWIVRNHGGEIQVDSALGKGTTFHLRLPLADHDCPEQTKDLRLTAPRPERTS
jgi:heavy metal sensor kinase